ncbi:MAG TPA: hypothetical protein VG078_05650 [Acidimicrobiales bacterium]|nr:hypothetical protein [Acidimicrobiales bacterium]
MDWLFFVVFGPLFLASVMLCGRDASLRNLGLSRLELDEEDREAFGRFLRSSEPLPPARLEPAATTWAEGVLRQERCRWNRYLNWGWVLWITAGLATAIAFGTARDMAVRLVVFDLMLLAVVAYQFTRRRAHVVLAATAGTGPR